MIVNVDSLHIEGTEETPMISFDVSSGDFIMEGRSLPEDAYSFFKPVIEWINEFIETDHSQVDMKIHLDYFNSSSGRYLMELLAMIEKGCELGEGFSITWISEKDDELMIEKGEEFQSLLNLPFQIQPV
jgi:hypothetical protein